MRRRAIVQVMPSTACNARCPYCYEEGHRILVMDESVNHATVAFIRSLFDAYEYVSLVWFGGEPLLSADAIEAMTDELMHDAPFEEDRLTRSTITNGALLGQLLHQGFFRRCGISAIQVSMDGFGRQNALTKAFLDRGCTYERLLDGIEGCLNEGIDVTVRMNVSTSNEGSLRLLADNLRTRFKNFACFKVYPAPLYGDGGAYLDKEDVYGAISRLKNGADLPCGAARGIGMGCFNSDTFVIQPDGNVVPCEHLFGKPDFYLGNVLSDVRHIDMDDMLGICGQCKNIEVCKQGCGAVVSDACPQCECGSVVCWRTI